jgi:2-oxoglutarate ferredoxin oxidoreductase subunit alpha
LNEFSVLIGGKAGDGINQAGLLLARLLAELGYRVYMDVDYPSLIRGGHNFSLVRAAGRPVATFRDRIDMLLALNQDTLDAHAGKLSDSSRVIYDSDSTDSGQASAQGLGLALTRMAKEEGAKPLMRNSALLGAFARGVGIEWGTFESVLRRYTAKEQDLNLKLARKGYDAATQLVEIPALEQNKLPIFTGNEAVGMGLVKAGLGAYVAYPMTPSSGLLHFLAGLAKDFSLKVIHPENEIAVMLMALGFSYAGEKVAVGTSGGGFCLMTEGLSLAGMAELPVVVVLGQRPGPSTGLPTYTAQGEMLFTLHAGHGEFVRFVVAPGDPEEAFYWAQVAMSISWGFQIPSIILLDKALAEGAYSFDRDSLSQVKPEEIKLWDGEKPYGRYKRSDTGVSPLAFAPAEGAVVKVNSYEHDEFGITTEEPSLTRMMQDKRLGKEKHVTAALNAYETVRTYGDPGSPNVLLCWGSNKGVCVEAGEKLGYRVVHVLVLSPLPVDSLRKALRGAGRVVAVENNATGQLARRVRTYGFGVDESVSKYDGRPFSLDGLVALLEK